MKEVLNVGAYKTVQATIREIKSISSSSMVHEEKCKKLQELWTNCYKVSFAYPCFEIRRLILDNSGEHNGPYVVDQPPNMEEMDGDKVAVSVAKLKEVQQNRDKGLNDGISVENAETILKWVLLNARKEIARLEKIDIMTFSLTGSCGLGQAMPVMSLQEIRLETTINNVSDVFQGGRHSFSTSIFPIKFEKDGEVTVVNQ